MIKRKQLQWLVYIGKMMLIRSVFQEQVIAVPDIFILRLLSKHISIMKKRIFVYSLLLVASSVLAQAQTFKFDFSSDKKVQEGFTKITPATLFNNEQGYGYDFQPSWDGKSNKPVSYTHLTLPTT